MSFAAWAVLLPCFGLVVPARAAGPAVPAAQAATPAVADDVATDHDHDLDPVQLNFSNTLGATPAQVARGRRAPRAGSSAST
jgi:hypothetical protein